MTRTLPPDLAAPLAELALRELGQAGFGSVDATGRSEAAIIADALGAGAALFAFDDEEPEALRASVVAGWEAPRIK